MAAAGRGAFLLFLAMAGSEFRSALAFAPAQVALLSAAGMRCSTGVIITPASFRPAPEKQHSCSELAAKSKMCRGQCSG